MTIKRIFIRTTPANPFKSIQYGVFFLHLLVFSLGVAAQQNGKGQAFDYAAIAPHPRLLLNKGEERQVKASLVRSAELRKVDGYIQAVSTGLLTQPPLVFKKEGKRLLAVSREALTRLFYLSYSFRQTGNIKYVQRAEQELNALCDFESWNPSHFLDVGEMCMAVAIGYDWLYDQLSERTKQKVRKAIVEKAFQPSYNKKEAWFLDAHSNWNSVCNAGLVFGALAIMDEEPEASIAVIERAVQSNLLPLKTFAPDGNYPEGPGYWNYGTSFQVLLSAALQSALGSDKDLSKAPGFMQSAYYMLFAQGPSGIYYNYYDCGNAVAPSPVMFWFAHQLKDPSLIYNEMALIRNGRYTKKGADEDRILPVALIFARNMDVSKTPVPVKKVYAGHGITPVAIVRTNWQNNQGKYLGIKGGSAADGHAHMDQGSFVYDEGGLRWAMDFGMQSYITLESKGVDLWNMKQNSQRWDIFRYNNLNHNTISINNQRHNVKGKATLVQTLESGKELGAIIDLAPALNLNDELRSATRKAVIVNDAYLQVEDAIAAGPGPVDIRWNMVTPATAAIVNDHTIRLTQKGKAMLVTFKSDVPFKVVIRPSENPEAYKCEYGDYNYASYNQPNKGTVMIGFDAKLPATQEGKFTALLKMEEK
ncbi:heparinase II/III family protein [Niabella sp. CJ426]|uniref:heparinase II/III domain-containing protein n=1 Tax=Niabella sp. CJ426 TaxID=3393740 RepID=UPI003D08DEB4